MEPGADEICSGSNSSGMHSLQCSSQQQLNMHQQKKEEIQQHGEQQHQQLMQEWQQQLEDPSDQQEQFELDQAQHPEQSQLQPYVENEHRHLEPPQLQPYVENEHRHLEPSQMQQKQQWQADQQQQLQQVQMHQMLQHTQQQHLQEIHSQQQKLQQSQDQQELVTQLQQQLQPEQQESPSQSEEQDMEVQLQQQNLPLQELELQLQQQELALQLQQQQLTTQMPHEDLKQMTQAQQQQLEQSAAEPQQQHLKQLQQSQQHLQQPQQQLSQHFPLQPQQQYVPQSQQQPQKSSLEPQHQHLQPLSQHQQLALHSQQQHLPQPQQQTQQQQLQLLSQHQQQSEQLPLQSQEQHLPQSQQRPQQQLQQSTLASQHQHLQQLPQPQQQPQLQQAPLPSQQQHLQQLTQSQQQPQQKLQQMSLQQQQQHLQQSQQQAQQHLQQASMSSHQQTQQQMPQPQQQLPHPQQQHLQPSSQPQKQHLQQLPQSQQQRSQQLPQAQQQLQQPQPQQQRSQLQPHMQQLSQSQQQLQQKQLQPQVQQQQQLSSQHPSQPAAGQAAASARGQNISGSHSISFGSLIPMILPHLSKEQSDRLQGLYTRLRRNEVTKEDFLRATRNVVGDQMLVQAVRQMQHKHQGQSQLAPSSQASQLHQQQLQQQQQRQQQHAQGSSQQFLPQQSIHTQQVNEPQPFQQVSPTNLQPQAQNTSDFQPHSQSSAPASLTVPHTSSDNKTQQSRQPGEPRPEISSAHGNQTTTMNLHQVKHEVDRTMIGFPISSQQQQHLQVPPSSFPMYVRPPGNYSSQSFSASPGIPLGGVKSLPQDSQLKQVMHPQVGVQAHGGPPQLSNIKNMSKFDLSKQAKRREDEERQKIMQSSGAAHFSGQHQPSVWATSLDKEKAGNTGISPSSSVHIKQEINDNSDQQHNFQTLQPMKDNLPTIKAGPMDHGQSLMLTKTDSIEHQSIKASGISSVNHPLGSSGLHSDHLMQAPLATSAAMLHHTLSGFSGPVQMRPQVPSTPPSAMVGSQIKTPPKKMLIGQKKPFDASGSSMQLGNKKQKVSTGYLDQSIDQLNDVTAVSGVNLREEEEQLFAGPKEESRATEAMRKVVQEEEERIFLQKGSFRTKLAGIMAKYGIKYISSDSERCLSLCVEERLRTMIGHLIRLSKQRVDLERASHKVTITSDVQRQILAMNKKAKDDLEKKQAEEAEKLRKLNEIENVGTEGEKDETRTKAQKAQKEEDDKMRANAANVAARAAVGGDDMLSKWQLMAEQARQKREGTSDGASNTRTNKDANRKSVVGGLKSANVSDHQDTPSTGVVRNLGRTSGPLSQTKPVRSICIKDVIALLEREPQMTKSTLLYRLYERNVDCSKEKGTEVQNNENTLQ